MCSYRRLLISKQIFVIEIKFATKLCVFAVILVSKERYNVNKRITRFRFADYLFSYDLSQTLHLYAISAFKIMFLFLVFYFKKKDFPAYMKNTFSLPSSS